MKRKIQISQPSTGEDEWQACREPLVSGWLTQTSGILSCYRDRSGIKSKDYPNARDCDADTMAIPLHNRMSKDDYGFVIGAIKKLALF